MSTDSEISSASTRTATHTELAKASISREPQLVCEFDHMFDAVQKNFGIPTTDWTYDKTETAAALLARQICSTARWERRPEELSGLPKILRGSSFSLYAEKNLRLHLIAALLVIVLDVTPSLRVCATMVENELSRVIFRNHYGVMIRTEDRRNKQVDLLAVYDMLCETNAIKSSVIDRLGLGSKTRGKSKKAKGNEAMERTNPVTKAQLLQLGFTIPPKVKVFRESFRVVEILPQDVLLGLEHFKLQGAASDEGLGPVWSNLTM